VCVCVCDVAWRCVCVCVYDVSWEEAKGVWSRQARDSKAVSGRVYVLQLAASPTVQ
jgi:hypothetical protein